jgi:hypothetical protein
MLSDSSILKKTIFIFTTILPSGQNEILNLHMLLSET